MHETEIETTDYRKIGPPVEAVAEGLRADAYLAQYYPFHSRSGWRAEFDFGRVYLNGRLARPSKRLRRGDQLTIFHPLSAEPEADQGIRLIAEQAGIIAVYKPGVLPMHESGRYRRRTFAARVMEEFGKEWHPVHRLDRETSGIVLCAAEYELRRSLSLAFTGGQIRKYYQAIVFGCPEFTQIEVDAPIAIIANGLRPRYIAGPQALPGGLPAKTGFKVLERKSQFTLLEARPYTGRTNQIRVHLEYLGHPLVGDKIYHPDPAVYLAYHQLGDHPDVSQLAGFRRHALHAQALSFTHPVTKKEWHLEAPLPCDLRQLWQSVPY